MWLVGCACQLHQSHYPACACVKGLKELVLSVCQFVSLVKLFKNMDQGKGWSELIGGGHVTSY